MRHRGGFGRVCALLGVMLLSTALSACFGQGSNPNEYELGSPETEDMDTVPSRDTDVGTGDATGTPSGDFAAKAGDVVYFQGDSAQLSPQAKATLWRQIRWLQEHPNYRVTVEGHADEWGTQQHNLALGAERAVAVKTFLANNGLGSSRILTVSYGKEHLVADCTALECKAKNRRARTIVIPETAWR